jgi:serine/threonine protein kinase
MVPPPDDTPESLDGQATSGGEPDRPVEKSIGERETAGNDPSTDSIGTDFDENWTPPEMLADRYRLEDELGRGGMGVVYRARDTQLKRTVAVKLISRGTVARFQTEAEAIAQLDHPNIVHVYEFNQQDDLYYIVMSFIQGESLSQRLTRGTIPTEEALRITISLCEALAHAHGKGIIHRDIKPSNVLLSDEGVPKLVDFGLARIESDQGQHTRAGATLGTIDYMSPEQRRDAAGVDHRSDLWSLGATFYEMLTGEPPHPVDMESIPESVHSTMAKVLKRKPGDRYQAAEEFRDALRDVRPDSTPVTSEGVLVEGECPSCGTTNDSSRKFCKECAAALRVSCLSCEEHIPVWDKVCGECGGRQAELLEEQERVASLLSQADQHRASYDYASAVQTLEQIPEPLRTTETTDLLVEMKRTTRESTELLATIRERIGNKDLEGLLDQVTRALELLPDRQDLQKIKGQLWEREEREKKRTLTEAVANQFRAEEFVRLYEFTKINEAAAVSLSKHKGGLNLNGLTSLSDAAAKSVSKHKGHYLKLDGLTSLSDEAAKSFRKHEGKLSLDGLTSLSDEAANILSNHKGSSLSLAGLASLSDAAAKSLSRYKGEYLNLAGLITLSDAAAESLSKYKGEYLELDLNYLSESKAEILRQHPSLEAE